MAVGKSAAVVLAAAVVAWGTNVWAADPPAPRPAERVPSPARAATATPRRPLMQLFEQAGIADTLDRNKISAGGRVEAGWTYNFGDPNTDRNNGRVFDFEHNEPILDQLAVFFEKKVDTGKNAFDIGGKVEAIWGADAGLIHANGLTDWYDTPRSPENQLDLTQLYIDVNVPVGNGLLLRVGKFVTIIGQEVIDPEGNSLYSHSFLFGFSQPLTHTGILGSYNLSDDWAIMLGVTRGWDQAFEDNNDALEILGAVKWAQSKDTTFILNVSAGPERAGNNDDWRFLLDLIASHTVSDQLAIAVNADLGWEDGAGVSSSGVPNGDSAI